MGIESQASNELAKIKPAETGTYTPLVGLNGDSCPHTIFTFKDPNTGEFLGGSIEFGQSISIEYPDDHLIEYEYGTAKTISGILINVDGGLWFSNVTFSYTNDLKRTLPNALVFPMVGMTVTQEGREPFVVQSKKL